MSTLGWIHDPNQKAQRDPMGVILDRTWKYTYSAFAVSLITFILVAIFRDYIPQPSDTIIELITGFILAASIIILLALS